MNLPTVLLVVLVILLLGALPTWPYSADWGYYPSSGLGLLLVIVLVLFFARRGPAV
jgi:MFS superfamily sulfate permease-like transporter